MMPEVSGWDALAALKADDDERVREIPVVMLTALSAPLDRAKGGIEGAVRYLAKPIAPDDLRATVTEALGGEPEPVQRRRAQQEALESIARIERARRRRAGDAAGAPHPPQRPRGAARRPPRPPAPAAARPRAARRRASPPSSASCSTACAPAPTVMRGGRRPRHEPVERLRQPAPHRPPPRASRSVTELLDLVRAGHVVG